MRLSRRRCGFKRLARRPNLDARRIDSAWADKVKGGPAGLPRGDGISRPTAWNWHISGKGGSEGKGEGARGLYRALSCVS